MLPCTINAPRRAHFAEIALERSACLSRFDWSKYPNRRLYDTKTSAYITLADVKALVLAHQNFKVVDAKTGDDSTRSILLQIIVDEERRACRYSPPAGCWRS